ncbi:MAG TPA: MFS transporter [Candidatus Acidoferrales bacterium]|nr:MFS transporter [Candidatus Acidoferrales bacterium]
MAETPLLPAREVMATPSLAAPTASTPRGLVAFRALRHRNFRLFFAGQLISLIGTWMQTVAQSWLVYRMTGSAVLLGTVGFVSQIPVFFLATVGGIVADRYPKRQIVVATQATSMILAFLLAWLTLTGRVQVWQIIVLSALLGVVNAFDIPARQSFFVEIVGKDDLQSAIGLNSSIFNGARIIGPAIAGILVALIQEGWCFFVNGVSFIAVITGLLMMRVKEREIRSGSTDALQEAMEGFRYALGSPTILALLLLVALVSAVGVPYTVLMPIVADRILHGGPRTLGLLMGATGVGAMMGALTLAMHRGVRGLGRIAAAAACGFGASLVLFSFSRWFAVSMVLLIPVGYCVMLQMAATNTLLQTMAPDRLRGRVMALYSMMFMGMAPVGSLGAGFAADRLGVPVTLAIGGAACIVGSLVFARRLPQIRAEALEHLRLSGALEEESPAR